MAFKGIFIGINKYLSLDIEELTCAKRDAIALHALFTDTLGDGGRLLVDQEATRDAIESEFNYLTQCDPDDCVVITFSGHGSEAHHLATYNAHVDNLDETAIPLTKLHEWITKIPARQLILFLDCCFSGGQEFRTLLI